MAYQLEPFFAGGLLEMKPTKLTISFVPAGNAGPIKHPKIKASPEKQFSSLIQHVRNCLGMKSADKLYIYAQQAYAPDETLLIHDLNLLCGLNGVITLHYALEPIWG
jgi:hypothetical protein